MAAFEDLCNQVTGEVLENVNHLARGTRTILKTTELTDVPTFIGKKNFTLTSDNHLAALFIKIIQCYVNVTFTKSDESKTPAAIKKEKLSKYIWQLQKGKFKESTKKKIFTKFQPKCPTFFELIDEPKKFENILIKAAKLTQKINLDTDITEKLERKRNEIDEIIAEATDYTTDLSDTAKTLLSDILKKIKNTCKDPQNHTALQNALTEILTKPEIKYPTLDSPEWYRIRTEVAALTYVIMHWKNADIDEQFVQKLKHCHKSTINNLIKTKKRIVAAYAEIDKDNAEANTPAHDSSSSGPNGSANINQKQNPRTPESPPPELPTSAVSDQPPPLRPAKTTALHTTSKTHNPRRKHHDPTSTPKLTQPKTLTAPPSRTLEKNSKNRSLSTNPPNKPHTEKHTNKSTQPPLA